MNKKTISINTDLLRVGGAKTRKKREKVSNIQIKPLISPNVLKNKLLKRIKEHKQRETKDLENNKRTLPTTEGGDTNPSNKLLDDESFSDEFNESINYLQTLSKQKKIDDEKRNYDAAREKRKAELERKTLRHYGGLQGTSQNIQLDLPAELRQPLPVVNPVPSLDPVPYGILKNGTKPTYSQWTKTQRNAIVTDPRASLIVPNERENRLNILKMKIQQKKLLEQQQAQAVTTSATPLAATTPSTIITPLAAPPTTSSTTSSTTLSQGQEGGRIIATKKITKKTIKKKYTLGRSNIKRTVSVLIKDRGTRKNILSAQKDLKKKNMNDIKTYLKEHNLIKIGSNAPNDVLRKMYESAMLAGEITNQNANTLIHNLTKEDKEL